MDNLENNKILDCDSIYKDNIIIWRRYIVDIFCIWKKTAKTTLDKFLTYIRGIDRNIDFTLEVEENNALNFLNLMVTKKSRRIEI